MSRVVLAVTPALRPSLFTLVRADEADKVNKVDDGNPTNKVDGCNKVDDIDMGNGVNKLTEMGYVNMVDVVYEVDYVG